MDTRRTSLRAHTTVLPLQLRISLLARTVDLTAPLLHTVSTPVATALRLISRNISQVLHPANTVLRAEPTIHRVNKATDSSSLPTTGNLRTASMVLLTMHNTASSTSHHHSSMDSNMEADTEHSPATTNSQEVMAINRMEAPSMEDQFTTSKVNIKHMVNPSRVAMVGNPRVDTAGSNMGLPRQTRDGDDVEMKMT